MAETSTIFGFMKYVSATDILSDFKKTVDSYFVNSLKAVVKLLFLLPIKKFFVIIVWIIFVFIFDHLINHVVS